LDDSNKSGKKRIKKIKVTIGPSSFYFHFFAFFNIMVGSHIAILKKKNIAPIDCVRLTNIAGSNDWISSADEFEETFVGNKMGGGGGGAFWEGEVPLKPSKEGTPFGHSDTGIQGPVPS
jgi:hypothetical protein